MNKRIIRTSKSHTNAKVLTTATMRLIWRLRKRINKQQRHRLHKKEVIALIERMGYRDAKRTLNALAPKKPKVKKLPKTLMNQIRRTRKAMKKTQVDARLDMKTIRKALGTRGYRELVRQLRSQERYARGYAYDEQVRWFLDRLQTYSNYIDHPFDDIIRIISKRIDKVKDKVLMEMYNHLYNAEHNEISAKELERYLTSIIDNEIL